MFKLKNNEYQLIKPLLKNINHNIALVYSVIEGNHLGSIYVNDINNPSYALIATKVNYLFLIGDLTKNNIDKNFYNFIINEVLKELEKEMILFTFSNTNEQVLEEIFTSFGVIKIKRKTFKLNKEKFQYINHLDNNLSIKPIDNETAKKAGIDLNICDFSKKSIGYYLTDGLDILSYCYSIFVGNSEVEIDVKTNSNHLKKGYAYTTASRLLNECIKRNLKPNWACWPYNTASINLAKKLTFTIDKDITAFFWAENM